MSFGFQRIDKIKRETNKMKNILNAIDVNEIQWSDYGQIESTPCAERSRESRRKQISKNKIIISPNPNGSVSVTECVIISAAVNAVVNHLQNSIDVSILQHSIDWPKKKKN